MVCLNTTCIVFACISPFKKDWHPHGKWYTWWLGAPFPGVITMITAILDIGMALVIFVTPIMSHIGDLVLQYIH